MGLETVNYIINNGNSLQYFYNDGKDPCRSAKDNYTDYLTMMNTFYTNYHRQVGTLNSDSGNIYIINLANAESFSRSTIFITITFTDDSTLTISFPDVRQATDNLNYLTDILKGYNILDYLDTMVLLRVNPAYTENIPAHLFNNIQSAVTNQSAGQVVYVETGDYVLPSRLQIFDSCEIYFEPDSSITFTGNHVIRVLTTAEDQVVNIYGYPDITGNISIENSVNDLDTGLKCYIEHNIHTGGFYHSNGGMVRIKGTSGTIATGHLLDTDATSEVIDFDVLTLTATDGDFIFPLSQEYSYMYFRNSLMNGLFNLVKTGGGNYIVNFIGGKLNDGYLFYSPDADADTVNLWNGYLITDEDSFIEVNDSSAVYLNLYGKNFANKTYPSYAVVSGAGSLTIDTTLSLTLN